LRSVSEISVLNSGVILDKNPLELTLQETLIFAPDKKDINEVKKQGEVELEMTSPGFLLLRMLNREKISKKL